MLSRQSSVLWFDEFWPIIQNPPIRELNFFLETGAKRKGGGWAKISNSQSGSFPGENKVDKGRSNQIARSPPQSDYLVHAVSCIHRRNVATSRKGMRYNANQTFRSAAVSHSNKTGMIYVSTHSKTGIQRTKCYYKSEHSFF